MLGDLSVISQDNEIGKYLTKIFIKSPKEPIKWLQSFWNMEMVGQPEECGELVGGSRLQIENGPHPRGARKCDKIVYSLNHL